MEQQKKRQLAALAHDIKTPLSIVTGNAELLIGKQPDRRTAGIYFIYSGKTRQADSPSCDRNARAFPFRPAFRRQQRHLPALRAPLGSSPKCGEPGKEETSLLHLTTEQLPDILPVPKDALQRILDNLIDNAVEYSPKNGTVFSMHPPQSICCGLAYGTREKGFPKKLSPRRLRILPRRPKPQQQNPFRPGTRHRETDRCRAEWQPPSGKRPGRRRACHGMHSACFFTETKKSVSCLLRMPAKSNAKTIHTHVCSANIF